MPSATPDFRQYGGSRATPRLHPRYDERRGDRWIVKAYVSAILLRLAVKNRVQAAIVAYEAGLVTS